jgi:hypothetical protein
MASAKQSSYTRAFQSIFEVSICILYSFIFICDQLTADGWLELYCWGSESGVIALFKGPRILRNADWSSVFDFCRRLRRNLWQRDPAFQLIRIPPASLHSISEVLANFSRLLRRSTCVDLDFLNVNPQGSLQHFCNKSRILKCRKEGYDKQLAVKG